MFIYKITNNITNKVYIGQTTKSVSERWWQHCNRSPSQTHRSAIFNAIKKYGAVNFKIEVLAETDSLEVLNELEIKYILEYNSLAPQGYNLMKGGDNKECHPDTKIRISRTLKGRPLKNRQNGAIKGRPITWGNKISAAMLGVAQPWKYKPVVAVETGEIYESVNAAARAVGVDRVTISGLIKSGKVGRCGLSFKFVT